MMLIWPSFWTDVCLGLDIMFTYVAVQPLNGLTQRSHRSTWGDLAHGADILAQLPDYNTWMMIMWTLNGLQ